MPSSAIAPSSTSGPAVLLNRTPIPAIASPKSTLNASGALPFRTKIDRPAATTGSTHEASTSSVTLTSPDASGNVLPGARLTDTPRCWSGPTVCATRARVTASSMVMLSGFGPVAQFHANVCRRVNRRSGTQEVGDQGGVDLAATTGEHHSVEPLGGIVGDHGRELFGEDARRERHGDADELHRHVGDLVVEPLAARAPGDRDERGGVAVERPPELHRLRPVAVEPHPDADQAREESPSTRRRAPPPSGGARSSRGRCGRAPPAPRPAPRWE